jgi:cytosine permease
MASLPSYLAAAKPVPRANRSAWYKNIAPTYAGVMLWFVFWMNLPKSESAGGVLAAGIGPALLGVVIAALLCHFLFYLVPGLLGMKTGLPLYIVGTSTYGARGGLIMPGFLMGLLQFGWLAVNASGVAGLLCVCFGVGLKDGLAAIPGPYHGTIAAIFAVAAVLVGAKGIQYVARVSTYLPLIPLVVLVVLFAKTMGGLGAFHAEELVKAAPQAAAPALGMWGVLAFLSLYVVGFFATAGAAGVDIASSSRNGRDVQLGGLTGITLATIFSGCLAILIVAGAHGLGSVKPDLAGSCDPVALMNGGLLSAKTSAIVMALLAISSFPGACFSSFIAVNSFRTTMPNVNPLISVGIGTIVAILMAVTGAADKVIWIFGMIGASFGPVCGAMMADYLLAGRKWAGPRAGFNLAGWISWVLGFAVGEFNQIAEWVPQMAAYRNLVPVPPVAAFLVGLVLYFVLAKIGLESQTLELPAATE